MQHSNQYSSPAVQELLTSIWSLLPLSHSGCPADSCILHMDALHRLFDAFQQSLAVWGVVPFQIAVHVCECIYICFKILLADWALNEYGTNYTTTQELESKPNAQRHNQQRKKERAEKKKHPQLWDLDKGVRRQLRKKHIVRNTFWLARKACSLDICVHVCMVWGKKKAAIPPFQLIHLKAQSYWSSHCTNRACYSGAKSWQFSLGKRTFILSASSSQFHAS